MAHRERRADRLTDQFLASAARSAEGLMKVWDVLNWAAWTVLWFSFFLLLALARKIQRLVAVMTLVCAIFTAWVPGLLILWQQMG